MSLTLAQETTLKAFILADPVLNAFPKTDDGAIAIQLEMNKLASPDFIVWRSNVPAGEIGNAWMGADIDGMSSLNMQRLQLMLASSPQGNFDMGRLDRRIGFLNPFGASALNPSRVAMNVVFRRKATIMEKLFATGAGAGTDAVPANLVIEGLFNYQIILRIIRS